MNTFPTRLTVLTAHPKGKEPCPQWTLQQIWYGRSSSCFCVWRRFHHTARRPPRWAARWSSLARRRQTPSYNPEGGLSWPVGGGLLRSGGKKGRIKSYLSTIARLKYWDRAVNKYPEWWNCVHSHWCGDNTAEIRGTQEMIQLPQKTETRFWEWIMLFKKLNTICPGAGTYGYDYITAGNHFGRPEEPGWFPVFCFN